MKLSVLDQSPIIAGRTAADAIAERITELAELFEADEVVVLSVAPDYGVRLKSYEVLARALIAT